MVFFAVATPSITRIAGGAHTRSRPSHSDRKSCSTRREISSRGRGYGCPNIADIVTPSEFRSGAKIPPGSVCASAPTVVPSCRMRIFIRSGVGTAREAPIQNRHFDQVVATPSITRIAGGAHTRSRPVTAIGSHVQLDARSPPKVVDMGARTSPI
ncbi:hypothetical protein Taro_034160 [Colocasia esculenta]|uniref:Uncharacterized protein n=1 Tax=Colocasia esculenta TaxID=4460 RepID=A0A843W943_COLES|nr:hypothetical protein [Colocasia esculenta]